ncbi:uncharacterized protein LOC131619905, partial [Vicia villosa]|uniref:uncharacterized protein LOC131619905 n=1 Tax=Vicia villosa TaxID=3911 RepID=UPI00273A94AB
FVIIIQFWESERSPSSSYAKYLLLGPLGNQFCSWKQPKPPSPKSIWGRGRNKPFHLFSLSKSHPHQKRLTTTSIISLHKPNHPHPPSSTTTMMWEREYDEHHHHHHTASLKPKDYYKILEVDYDVDDNAICSNYICLALKWHPDKQKDHNSATSMFQDINKAYQVKIGL